MSCNTAGVTTKKKKIVVLSSIATVIAASSYLAFTTTNNPTIAATIPAILSLVICPAMCIGIGSAFWLVSRFAKIKNSKVAADAASKEEAGESCCNILKVADKKKHDQRNSKLFDKTTNHKYSGNSNISIRQPQKQGFQN